MDNGAVIDAYAQRFQDAARVASQTSRQTGERSPMGPHLRRLEAQSIHIFRETVAEFRNPVLLYSAGKDSSVMLHLALKAFWPARLPFALLHVDSTWEFRELLAFRDRMRDALGFDLRIHVNRDGLERGIDPFRHGVDQYTQAMRTDGLLQALALHSFDAALGGGRRDEEKARAKERIFSLRQANQTWDPRSQRPELWRVFNTRIGPRESMRVFPLANWTELDIWSYIDEERIPVVPLYYAAQRPTIERDGQIFVMDDERFPLSPGECPVERFVRFRTLGCYPLTGAVESKATSSSDIVAEITAAQTSERHGRVIDHDQSSSMERKKRQGYF